MKIVNLNEQRKKSKEEANQLYEKINERLNIINNKIYDTKIALALLEKENINLNHQLQKVIKIING